VFLPPNHVGRFKNRVTFLYFLFVGSLFLIMDAPAPSTEAELIAGDANEDDSTDTNEMKEVATATFGLAAAEEERVHHLDVRVDREFRDRG
jgi:hypothetical protein